MTKAAARGLNRARRKLGGWGTARRVISISLALPMGMGLCALGGPIMGLLFPRIDTAVAGPLLSVLGIRVT